MTKNCTIRTICGGLLLLMMVSLPLAAHAAQPGKAAKASKEKLVLMPLRVAEEDRALQGAMETALVEGLQQKYIVFSGEQVAQKARDIFMKESRNTAKKECDETRCMQGIAEAFQAELIATANVTKQSGGYFLALSIQNIFDNKVEYSKSLPCRGCDSFQVVDKLKELVGAPAPVAAAPAPEEPQPKVNMNDPDGALWAEAQKGNSVEDYQVYLDTYPKGKYAPFAKARIKKIKEAAQAAAEQQEQQAWDTAQQENSEASYGLYLKSYPNGRFAGLAKVRGEKLKLIKKEYARAHSGFSVKKIAIVDTDSLLKTLGIGSSKEEMSEALSKADRAIKLFSEKFGIDLVLQEAVYRATSIDITSYLVKVMQGSPISEMQLSSSLIVKNIAFVDVELLKRTLRKGESKDDLDELNRAIQLFSEKFSIDLVLDQSVYRATSIDITSYLISSIQGRSFDEVKLRSDLNKNNLAIAVVDTERLLRESPPAIAAEKRIEAKFQTRDREIRELSKRGDSEELNRLKESFRNDLNNEKNRELALVLSIFNKEIVSWASEENIDLVLQEAVLRNPSIDITDVILKRVK